MTEYVTRVMYSIPGNMKADVEALLDQCASENGGKLVGEPSVRMTNGVTVLEVTEHVWWTETMRIHYLPLVLMGANQFMNKDGTSGDEAT